MDRQDPQYVDGFVFEGEPIYVRSSTLVLLQYFIDDHKLMAEFANGSAYIIEDVSEWEAIDLYHSPSKGEWYWDHVRVRGSKRGSQKAFRKMR